MASLQAPKIVWITNLRVFATLTVVLLHAAANGLGAMGKIPMTNWWICNIINTFGRFAVPIFVMLSGYLLIPKYQELSTFLQKRLLRICIPFLIWTFLYIIWGNFYGIKSEKTGWHFMAILSKILVGGGGGAGHLWFVYMLLGLYAFTPIISRWLDKATTNEMIYFLIISLIVNSLMPALTHFYGIDTRLELRYFSGFVGYFVLGYYLGNVNFIASSKQLGLCIGVFILAWIFTAFVVFEMSWPTKIFDNLMSGYLSFGVVLMSGSIFLFFKHFANIEFLPKLMASLDASSFGIYLVHILILKTLSRQYHLNYTFMHPLVGVFLHFLATATLSFLVVYLLKKIPKGSWVVG